KESAYRTKNGGEVVHAGVAPSMSTKSNTAETCSLLRLSSQKKMTHPMLSFCGPTILQMSIWNQVTVTATLCVAVTALSLNRFALSICSKRANSSNRHERGSHVSAVW